MDCTEEARKWFREGTRTLTVRRMEVVLWGPVAAATGRERQACMCCVSGADQPTCSSATTCPPGAVLRVCLPACCSLLLQGKASHALWQAWALMEQKQGDKEVVRALFRRGLEVR